jgi:hypothetical protein
VSILHSSQLESCPAKNPRYIDTVVSDFLLITAARGKIGPEATSCHHIVLVYGPERRTFFPLSEKRGRGASKQSKWHVDDAITNHVQTEHIPSTVYYKSIFNNNYYI